MVTAEASTLAPNTSPKSTSVPRGDTPNPPPDGGATAAADAGSEAGKTGSKRGRGTGATKSKKPGKPPEPLTSEELQSLGSLMADAAALGQSVEDYVNDLATQLVAHDRLIEVTGAS